MHFFFQNVIYSLFRILLSKFKNPRKLYSVWYYDLRVWTRGKEVRLKRRKPVKQGMSLWGFWKMLERARSDCRPVIGNEAVTGIVPTAFYIRSRQSPAFPICGPFCIRIFYNDCLLADLVMRWGGGEGFHRRVGRLWAMSTQSQGNAIRFIWIDFWIDTLE